MRHFHPSLHRTEVRMAHLTCVGYTCSAKFTVYEDDAIIKCPDCGISEDMIEDFDILINS